MSVPFHDIVRFHRRQAGLTQAELADLAGVGKTVVFDIEHGKKTVRLTTLLRVLHALGVTLSWTSPLRRAYDDDSCTSPTLGATTDGAPAGGATTP